MFAGRQPLRLDVATIESGRAPLVGLLAMLSALKSCVLAVVSAGAVVSAAESQTPPPPQPPIEAYASLPALDQVSISPDGSRIAFIGAIANGGRRLGVQTLAGQALGVVDLGDQKVRAVSWGDDDHVLVTTSDYVAPSGMLLRGEFFNAQSYDVRDRDFVLLMNSSTAAGRSTASIRRSGGSGRFNFIQGTPFQREINGRISTYVWGVTEDYSTEVFSVDLDTGVGSRQSDFGGVMRSDGQPVARAGWDRDRGRFWVSAKRGAGWTEIWHSDGNMIDRPQLLGFGRTDQTVLLSVPEATSKVLYELPLDGSAARKLSFGEDLHDPSPIYHRYNGRLLGFRVVADDNSEIIFTDPELAERWAAVTAAYPDQHVTLTSSTPDFDKMVILTEGAEDSGTYVLIDLNARTAKALGRRYPGVPGEALGDVRFTHYRAADGMMIPAYLTLPPGREPRDLPLVVLPHGGPQARDEPGFDYWAQLLASRGYAVLQPQFRGSDGFGVAHVQAGYGEWGRKMQSDLTDGVRYLVDAGIADAGRVCIFGWSYGGYAAMAGATLDADTYRCAIAGAGVSDLPRMLAWERDQTGGRDSDTVRYWSRFMGAARINDNSIAQVSPARLADRVRAPVMLIHGRDDSVVPYEQSELFRKAMVDQGKTVEMIDLQGEDHWLSRASGRLAVFRAAVDFLERNNPPN